MGRDGLDAIDRQTRWTRSRFPSSEAALPLDGCSNNTSVVNEGIAESLSSPSESMMNR